MYASSGPASERNGDSTMTSSTPGSHSSHSRLQLARRCRDVVGHVDRDDVLVVRRNRARKRQRLAGLHAQRRQSAPRRGP